MKCYLPATVALLVGVAIGQYTSPKTVEAVEIPQNNNVKSQIGNLATQNQALFTAVESLILTFESQRDQEDDSVSWALGFLRSQFRNTGVEPKAFDFK